MGTPSPPFALRILVICQTAQGHQIACTYFASKFKLRATACFTVMWTAVHRVEIKWQLPYYYCNTTNIGRGDGWRRAQYSHIVAISLDPGYIINS
jgi:hypothetical protein